MRVAVVGSGLIGRSWALVFLKAGMDVYLCDLDHKVMCNASTWIAGHVASAWIAGGAKPSEKTGTIRLATDLASAVGEADYVQECAPERLDVKTELFKRLDEVCKPDTIIGSSTSALCASDFCSEMKNPARALVAHPVNPPHLVPIVELVPSRWTDQSVLDRAHKIMTLVGQVPIVLSKEIPGFVLNRLQAALVNEAIHLVEDGVAEAHDIDQAVSQGLGLRWAFAGPFETMDLNADEGFAGYSAKFGDMYADIGRSLNVDRPWRTETCQKVTESLRRQSPAEKIPERQAWRDSCVSSLRGLKSELANQR